MLLVRLKKRSFALRDELKALLVSLVRLKNVPLHLAANSRPFQCYWYG